MTVCTFRLVGHQHFHDHFARGCGAVIRCVDHHAFGWLADTGCRQDTFTFNFNHTSPAIAIRAVIVIILIAKMGDGRAFALGHLPDAFIRICRNCFAIECEFDLISHDVTPMNFLSVSCQV